MALEILRSLGLRGGVNIIACPTCGRTCLDVAGVARKIEEATRLWPDGVSPITKTDIDDFILYITLGIILGGRLGYVLFYDLPTYLANPLHVFAVCW